MIVADASIFIDALLDDGAARDRIEDETICVPHLVDIEVMSALRTLVLTRTLDLKAATKGRDEFCNLEIIRYQHLDLLPRVWELRDNLSAYDATYVSLAEFVDAPLVTVDARLAAAPGIHARVEVLPPSRRNQQ